MSTPIAPPASRNAPCPCGSGRRYKDCHGAIAAAPPDPLQTARERLAAGDVAAAMAICDARLAEAPDDPRALLLKARGETEMGEGRRALRRLLRAARAIASTPASPQDAMAIYTALNSTFIDVVGGQDAAANEARRAAYRAWQRERRAASPNHGQPIAIVMPVRATTSSERVIATVDALLAQTRRPAELVVVPIGEARVARAVELRLDLIPFEVRFLPPSPGFASAIEAGIAASRAPWIVVLDPPNGAEPDHLARLVGEIEARDAAWGFTDGALLPGAAPDAAALAARLAAQDATTTTLAKADALGFALLDQTFAPIGAGALAFSRALHARVGALRPLRGHELWDFAVRALWHEEPVHVDRRSYRHAAPDEAMPVAEREAAQLAMFRDYYARACADDAAPPNPHAPALATWGLAFLRRMFQVGHVLMVDLPTLERLADRIDAAAEAAPTRAPTPGVNLLGFAFGEFGLGENLRALARACEAGAIPFVVRDIDQRIATRQADRTLAAHVVDELRHTLTLMCVNPDLLPTVRGELDRTRRAGGVDVGYWYWELETTPRTWEPAYDAVDEIWCATEFVAGAIRRATDRPVHKIPPPIEVRLGRRYARHEFGLPDGCFLFLFTFDYNSFVRRKNPEAAIAAFRAAFPRGRDDVGLVVKSVNGLHRPERVEAMRALAGDDPRIVLLDRFLSRDESYGLIDATDAYVSLHRAEGLGLGLAEAMALGRPTIATGYSGNLEFMGEGNSLLVDYRLVPVPPGDYLVDDERFVWAEPDVEHAAAQMRALADDASRRARIAEAGRHGIATRFTRERTATLIRQRLAALGVLPAAAPTPRTAGDDARESFVSWAQNGEDARLAHVLRDVARGRYVDVGANDPDVHSVTRAFYERGWSGVNVEPVAEWHRRLVEARPRDVNLAVAVSERSGRATIHAFAGTGLSTLDPAIARQHRDAGREAISQEVDTCTLAELFDRHVDGEVHLLKIDVEGAEAQVLAGADLARHRPWVVVVEATQPMTAIPTHARWDARLLGARYRFAHDDGLNRYYVADEHAALLPRFDEPLPFRVVRAPEVEAARDDLPAERRYDPAAVPFLDLDAPEPTLARPTSQLCTAAQFREPRYHALCRALREPPTLRRKQWEWVWLLACLEAAGLVGPGKRGLGFGCGREPIAAALAARGCTIVATDLASEVAAGHGWIETGQHARALSDLNERGLCQPDAFAQSVSFRAVDMNAIPDDLTGFDFVWSSCAFEHLGSLARGLAFVRGAMRCVVPGGLALHTTEFNLSSNGPTIESDDLSVYRRQDIERLARTLADDGHRLWPLNLQPGRDPVDRYVDLPPYRAEPHLKLRLSRFVLTSIGLAVERAR